MEHLAVGRLTAPHRLRHLVRALEASREALLGAAHETLLANATLLRVKRGLALRRTVVRALVAALAVEVVCALVAGQTLITLEAGACAVETDTVAIARLLAHGLGAVRAIPSLKARTLGLSKRKVGVG